MMRLFQKIVSLRVPGLRYDKADVRDLYYCYRLLLKREPDEESWQYWQGLIRNHKIDLQTLVDGFLSTEEFQNLQEEARRETLIDLDGFQLFVRQNDFAVGAAIARERTYEPPVTAVVRDLLGPGDAFVDAGANIGYFTCMAAGLVGSEGNVYAFEPNPDNIYLIKKSIAANSFANVQLYPFAVAELAQTFKLDAGVSSSNARIIDFSDEAVPGLNATILVKAVTLDETLADAPKIDLIKLDIEGAEPRAWQGMRQIVRRYRPVILFEYSPELLQDTSHIEPAFLLDEIAGAGYDLFILSTAGKQSQTPQSRDQIVLAQAQTGSTHLDLVAYPK